MVEIGQLLRQTREAKELSLADVEALIRIRQRYLNALESGDWDDLPNPVTARGFLRAYAMFLGLNANDLLAQSQIPVQDSATDDYTAGSESGYKPINLDLYGDTTRRIRRRRRVAGFILALIPVIILAYLLYQFGLPYLRGRMEGGESIVATVALPPAGKTAEPQVIIEPTATTAPTATRPIEPATDTPSPAPTQTPTFTPSPTLTVSSAEAIRLRVVVTNTAWVRVVTDGQVQVESLEDPGYEMTFTAKRQLEFLTGNAGGVSLTLDGKPLPPLGEIGQVIIFIWTLNDGQVVEITPTPTMTPTATSLPKQTTTATPTPTGNGGG